MRELLLPVAVDVLRAVELNQLCEYEAESEQPIPFGPIERPPCPPTLLDDPLVSVSPFVCVSLCPRISAPPEVSVVPVEVESVDVFD